MESTRSVKTLIKLSKTASSLNSAVYFALSQNRQVEQAQMLRSTLRVITTSKIKFTANRFMKVQRLTKNQLGSCLRRKPRLQVMVHETLLL